MVSLGFPPQRLTPPPHTFSDGSKVQRFSFMSTSAPAKLRYWFTHGRFAHAGRVYKSLFCAGFSPCTCRCVSFCGPLHCGTEYLRQGVRLTPAPEFEDVSGKHPSSALLPLFLVRVPLLNWTTEKHGYPYSNLSTGRPIVGMSHARWLVHPSFPNKTAFH